MAAAIMGARLESGPMIRTREGPNTAYASRGITEAYSPVTAGSPAASAYAMPAGMRNALRAAPEARSDFSHGRS